MRWPMTTHNLRWLAIPILVLFALVPAWAQTTGPVPAPGPEGPQPPAPTDAQPAATQNDPGVARVSFINGDVTMQRGDSGDVSSVTLNTPLMAGDKISTGDGSRTEVQLDYANILRLDRNAQSSIATLDKNRIQVQIGQGLAGYSVLKGSEADVEIDTPNVSIHPVREGRYRIQVNSDGDTFVTVNDGEAQVSTSEGSTTVKKYQLITVRGTGTDAQYKVTEARDGDDWDKWNKDRDNVIYNATGYRKTNRYYTGAGDLDEHGTWTEVPDYGQVWVPRVDSGWAPYRDGRWVWEPYWGWTWVSYEPWGWAPYHYGRWFDLSGLSPDLGPCIRFLLRIWRRGGFRCRVWVRLHWLAADRTLRLLPSLVGRFSRPLRSCRIRPNRRPPGWNRAAAWRQSVFQSSQRAR